MSLKNRLFGGMGIFILVLGVTLLVAVIGRYEATRRSSLETEQRDRFANLEEQLEPSVEKLKRLTVLYKERPQPLDTLARGTIRALSGSRSLYGVDCTLLFASIAFDDDFDWENTPLFRVDHGQNKELLGMKSKDKLATRPQINNSKAFADALNEARQRAAEGGSTTKIDEELFKLFGQVRMTEGRLADYFKIVPPTEQQRLSETPGRNDWHLADGALAAGHKPADAAKMKKAFREIGKAWRQRDNEALAAAVNDVNATARAMAPDLALEESAIEGELAYNQARPFTYASWFFVVAALMAIGSMAFEQRWMRLLAIVVSLIGLGLFTWGFYMRIVLGFGIAITNLYESMVAVAGLAVLMFLIVDLVKQSSWGMAFGGFGGFAVLQIVDLYSVKFDDTIAGPMAVLANNIWIHIHVPVVMSAYAFYFVAFLMAVVALPWLLMKRDATGDADLKGMLRMSDIAVNLGTIFMLGGLVLGGVWAQVSWGRFWGWDPKETWGLILFLWFLVIVHGRFTKRINAFWNAWLIFFGGNVLLWTYYGTNELLSGLHSYANSAGEGGFIGNFIHERNRWFVWTSGIMLLISIGTAIWYQFAKSRVTSVKAATEPSV